MGEAALTVLYYSVIILYLFFKLIVITHVIKNNMGYFWMLGVLLPGVDFYYYYKYAKPGN
jgi:hypothetical protein